MPTELNKLTPHSDGKRRKMKMTKLTAVALTAAGANPHADVTFFKTKDKPATATSKSETNVEKRSFLASAADGHSHLIPIGDWERVRMAGETSWQDGHTHPFVINDDGTVDVGQASGHNHTLVANVSELLKSLEADNESDSVNKNAADVGGGQEHTEDTTMPEDNIADNKAATKVVELEKKLATATALATLTDMQKVHFNSLDENDKETFLGKSNDERNVDIAAAKDADAIVYKAQNGAVYRKSDDPRLIAMAKERDLDRDMIAKERASNAEAAYKNRAVTELSHLPGTTETHVALLKSIDDVEDAETREAMLASLKAQNASFSPALQTVGTSSIPNVSKAQDDAVAKMDSLTKQYQKDNDVADYYEAYDQVGKIHPETLEKAMAG